MPCAKASRTSTRATWRRSGWSAGARTPRCSSANSLREAHEMSTTSTSTPGVLAGLVAALATTRIRVVDLTHTLTPEFPQIALPPEMGQCWPFRVEEVSRYDERGPGWYWNNFSCGEHTGTH